MPTKTYERDDVMIERMLVNLGIDVPLQHIENWHDGQAEEVERWCVGMASLSRKDGLAIQPIPEGLAPYARAYR